MSAPTRPEALRHRSGSASVTVHTPDGRPLAGAGVVVEQLRHEIAFGNVGFDVTSLVDPASQGAAGEVPAVSEVGALWMDVFNTATLQLYWASFEPERGRPDTQRLLRAARWFVEHGVVVRGHPLAWHTLAPHWLLDASTDEVEATLRARITREVTDFRGLIDVWDAINEVVIMPVFDKEPNVMTRLCQQLGRVETVRLAVDTARDANPDAVLLLNDFDMSPDYERLVEDCLEAGIRIDALGLQSHMHQGYWGEEKTLSVLDRFAQFGLPLHMTETTLVSGELMPPEIEDLNDHQVTSWPSTPEGEARQAEEIVRHYTTLVAHPAVQAITYWGLEDAGSWLGAPSGLVRVDGTPKPAYDALRGLVKGDWWLPPTAVRTDAEGRVEVEGFRGEYRVSSGGRSASFTIGAADGRQTLVLG